MSDELVLTILVRQPVDGGYWAEIAEKPGCFASGRDIPELFEALGEAIELYDTPEMPS